MSFYRRQRPSMGIVWLAPVMQLVGGALQSHPIEGSDIPAERTNPLTPIAIGVVGLALVGGLVYFAWRS